MGQTDRSEDNWGRMLGRGRRIPRGLGPLNLEEALPVSLGWAEA